MALLPLFIAFIDKFRRRSRRQKIQAIAQALAWDFEPNGKTHLNDSLPHNKQVNMLEGYIEGIPARIADMPVSTSLEPSGPGRAYIRSLPPNTVLFLEFSHQSVPAFKLRPRSWADGLAKPPILGKKVVIGGNEEDILRRLFDKDAIQHYERTHDLYVHAEPHKVIIQYRPDNYLPATKESYLDLVAEGKYLVALMKRYFSENDGE